TAGVSPSSGRPPLFASLAKIPAADVQINGFTGPQGSQARDLTGSINENTLTFASNHPLAPNSGLTILLSWPKGYVTAPTVQERLQYLFRDNHDALWVAVSRSSFSWCTAFWPGRRSDVVQNAESSCLATSRPQISRPRPSAIWFAWAMTTKPSQRQCSIWPSGAFLATNNSSRKTNNSLPATTKSNI